MLSFPNHTPRERHLTFATIACVAFIVLLMLRGFWFIQSDDCYIFYSYAKNLASGNGYVFNIGERVNATTSPLYTILLALLYTALRFLPFISIPLLGHLIGAVSLFFLCYFLLRSFDSEREFLYPFILPLVFLCTPFLARAVGMETFLAMMLGMMALHFYVHEKLVAASFASSLSLLARPDMLLLAAVLVVYDFARNRHFPTIKMLAVFMLPVGAWLAFSLLYFGSVLPSTFSAKLVQTEIGLWGSGPVFFSGLVSGEAWFGGRAVGRLLGITMFLGVLVITAKWRKWSLLRHPVFHLILLWQVVYLVVYGIILDAPAYEWYYTPLALSVALIVALPIEFIYRLLSDTKTVPNWILQPIIVVVLVLTASIFPVVGLQQPTSSTYINYRDATEWLNTHAKAGESVATNCIGVVRYYYDKGPVIDGVGLVTPAVVARLKRGEFDWYINHYQPDYLLFQQPPFQKVEQMAHEEWFQAEYSLERIFRTRWHAAALYVRRNQEN
ncbi:hypothetical protein KKH27_12860 [bacterium]|nr:hypothetical protein [bacterium]MBU1982776.1 hypothetical protein [bacterium]